MYSAYDEAQINPLRLKMQYPRKTCCRSPNKTMVTENKAIVKGNLYDLEFGAYTTNKHSIGKQLKTGWN